MEESKQITVLFDDDSPGALAGVAGILSRHGVNILAMTASGNRRNGEAHLVADHTALAFNILRNHGYNARLEDVLCLPVMNVAGSLHQALQELARHEINIEYIYAFTRDADGGLAVLRCDDPARAKKLLATRFLGL